MRILRVITSLNPRTGGPAAGLRAITPIINEMGHITEVACLDGPEADFLNEFPAPVHALGPGLPGYRWSRNLQPWLHNNVERFDVVIVHGLWQYPGLSTRRACKAAGIPYFVYTHGMLDPWFKRTYPLKHLKKWLYWPWGEYRVLRDATAVFFTAEEEKRAARESFWLYRCNEQVVSYGTAKPNGDAAAQREQFLRNFPHMRNRRFVLFLSRIHEKKGCDLLVRAFAELKASEGKDLPDLVIAGPCEDASYLEGLHAIARDAGVPTTVFNTQPMDEPQSAGDLINSAAIHFLPMLSGDVKWGAFHAADAFILPSHQENFGIAVAEALACGKPVLISDKVNIWREILEDEVGFVASDTKEGTTDILRRWTNLSESARGTMGRKAQDSFEKRFEISRAAQNLMTTLSHFAR